MDENIPMQVAIYGRSATWQPGEDPVAEQMAQCKAFALEHRMRIVAVFEDHGASGSHGDRPGLHALTAAMGRVSPEESLVLSRTPSSGTSSKACSRP